MYMHVVGMGLMVVYESFYKTYKPAFSYYGNLLRYPILGYLAICWLTLLKGS